ncbi:MAG: hypothetical protein ACOCUH_04450 [Bacteriovoracia bacterium]
MAWDRRKRVIVYPRFQLTLVILNLAVLVMSFLFVGIQLKRSFLHLEKLGQKADLEAEHIYYKFLSLQENTMLEYMLWAVLGSLILGTVITLILSHRLAGPMIRIRSYFSNMLEAGKAHPFKFRKRDYFAELPDIIWTALKAIKNDQIILITEELPRSDEEENSSENQ